MVNVSVSQLKVGDQIAENVLTRRSNLLLEKGKYITLREIEVLQAFLIPTVNIELKVLSETGEEIKQASVDTLYVEPPIFERYEDMVKLVKQIFNSARTGMTPPILEIRNKLEALLQCIDQYNVLSFSPKSMRMKEYLYHNSVMVALTSYQLAKWHGYPQKDLIPIAMSGLLHDIGNAKVDSAILEKASKLTPAELEEVKKHTVYGYQIVKVMPAINEGVKLCALQHHERCDGSGYPMGITGDKIHPYSKVVAIADIFHAMTNEKLYKKATSPYLVLEELFTEAFGKLDPGLVQTFIARVTSFHNGTLVRLSDNRIGEIVFSDRSYPTRPWVNINGTIVNLTLERKLFIQEVIPKAN